MAVKFKPGDKIKILYMQDEPTYRGKIGEITYIDDFDQIHGTWGGLALCADYGDNFKIIKEDKKDG